ncbi:MAG: hypothetical protein U0941_29400 [Planctomycetaceae bacterium]
MTHQRGWLGEFFDRFGRQVLESTFDIQHLEMLDMTTEATFEYVMSAVARF